MPRKELTHQKNQNIILNIKMSEHQIIEQSQRAGASPKKLAPVPPFPTGEKASGNQDNPESEHEPKGKPCRPRNTQGPPPVKQI